MKRENIKIEPSASVNYLQKIGMLFMVLCALELSSITNSDAQRHGGFHGGYHGGFHGGFHGGHYGWGGGPFWHYSFRPFWGAIYWYLPYAAVDFYYGGMDYYCCDGIYYQNYDGKYKVVPAPYGYKVSELPKGTDQLTVDGLPYYYYYGTFYAPKDKKYEVVPAPVGAVVESIPDGYEKVEINGQTYYTLNDVQFKPVIRNKEIWYQVIKSKGSVNVSNPPPSQQDQNVKDSIVGH